MRPVVFATPNRMEIDTGHRAFDRAVGALGLGNVVGGGQYSSYIRARNTLTNPAGAAVEPGAMQDWDLDRFDDLPEVVREFVCQVAVDEDVILYEIRHHTSQRDRDGEYVKVRHGYIVTRTHDADHELLKKYYLGPTRKSTRVVDVCSEYLSNPPGTSTPISLDSSPRARLSGLAERQAA